MDTLFPNCYTSVLSRLRRRLAEPAPGLVQLLTGPRQVGKTTLLLELHRAFGRRSIYVAADSPEASLGGWWEQVWSSAEQKAAGGKKAVLLIDEMQYIPNWPRLLKAQADRIRRKRIPIHIVVSGSSALKPGAGSRETMAGRFERLHLLHWPARELVSHLGLSDRQAVRQCVTHGTYPGAQHLMKDMLRRRIYIRESIIDPAIGRDLLMSETVRRPALLRQVFALCIGHPAEIISLQKLCGQLMEKGALQTVAHYLDILEQASLVAAVRKFSQKTLRIRSSPPKLVPLNQAMLCSMETVAPPERTAEPERFGRWVENACIAMACNTGQAVHYWRAEPLEVDLVTNGSWGNWAIEVKTGPYRNADLTGLLEFHRMQPRYEPLVLCDRRHTRTAENAGVRAMAWEDFLLNGAPASKGRG